jgi:transcription antitermination protein NusB
MKVSAAQRSRARHLAMQAIYQWQMTNKLPDLIIAESHSDNDMTRIDAEYFSEVFRGATADVAALDEKFVPHLKGLAIHELDPVTLALLRLASYEFIKRIDVPYKVVINEAVNIAKKFGAEESHKFINGVLDKVAKETRAVEFKS